MARPRAWGRHAIACVPGVPRRWVTRQSSLASFKDLIPWFFGRSLLLSLPVIEAAQIRLIAHTRLAKTKKERRAVESERAVCESQADKCHTFENFVGDHHISARDVVVS